VFIVGHWMWFMTPRLIDGWIDSLNGADSWMICGILENGNK